MTTVQAPAPAATSGEGGEQTWAWADGIPGTGEPPPWFKADKYKTVDAQARAAAELEQKLGPAAELVGAPEDGYKLPEPPEGVAIEWDAEDPLLKGFLDAAKETGLSQKAVDKILQPIASVLADQSAQVETKLSEALGQLGENVDARIDHVEKVLVKNYGEDGYKALDRAIGNDPEAFKALEQLVIKAHGDAQLAGGGGQGGPAFTRADIEALQFETYPQGHRFAGQKKYDHDPEHRAKVDRMWKQLYPGEDRQQVG